MSGSEAGGVYPLQAEPLTLPALDGYPLAARWYAPPPEVAPRALVVIQGATGVPQGFYRHFARFLAGRGLATLTFDYRGIGLSRQGSLRGFAASLEDWGTRDIPGALAWARERHPELALIVVGHSFGGQALGLCEAPESLRGVVLVAAQSGFYGHWPLSVRWRFWSIWHLMVPVLTTLYGYLPGWSGIGEDLPRDVAREWARWCRHPDYLVGYVEGASERFGAIDRPILAWSFEDDSYAPRPAVEALLGHLRGEALEHRHLSPRENGSGGVGHFGFFRPSTGERLWPGTMGWLDTVLAPTATAAEIREAPKSRLDRSPWFH